MILFQHQSALSSTVTDRWAGFERTYISLKGCKAYYVKPIRPLPGNPWIWRSSFPDWHIGMDTILLKKGFHVGYVDIDNQYGSPLAMKAWDDFYRFMVKTLNMSPTPALEAVSRGALYALSWAKRNPDKVSCIYAETPVYDVKSWPGGKGKGIGDTDSWKQFKEVFKLSEKEAMVFADNPIDNLEGLAAFKVPVFNVIGLQDRITPREENTDLFFSRYTSLGGPCAVYPVTDGPQELNGHHFPINKADDFADYIYLHSLSDKHLLPYSDFYEIRHGLSNFNELIIKEKIINVGFLGGSITFNPGWRDKIIRFMRERFPDTEFHFISAGIPSLGSLPHAFRVKRDLLDSARIDLLFVEAAVNDRVNGTDSIVQVKALEGLVRQCKSINSKMDIILMSFADPDKTRDFERGITPAEVANHELIASHYSLPSINLAKEVWKKMENKEFTWDNDFKDLHPSPFGQDLYAATIKDFLESCFEIEGKYSGSQINHELPKPLNKFNFSNGRYLPPNKAIFNKDWKYDVKWKPSDHLQTRPGFVDVPALSSETPGAELTLAFSGSAIGMAVVSGADAGLVSYSIDDKPYQSIDLFTTWSGSLHLPWYVMFESNLKNGNHLLKLKVANEKNKSSKGNACRIINFLVNTNPI